MGNDVGFHENSPAFCRKYWNVENRCFRAESRGYIGRWVTAPSLSSTMENGSCHFREPEMGGELFYCLGGYNLNISVRAIHFSNDSARTLYKEGKKLSDSLGRRGLLILQR